MTKCELAREVYDLVCDEFKALGMVGEDDRGYRDVEEVLADLAHLMGAILKDRRIEWPSYRPIVKILKARKVQLEAQDVAREALAHVVIE